MSEQSLAVVTLFAGCLVLVIQLLVQFRPSILLKKTVPTSERRLAELNLRLERREEIARLLAQGNTLGAIKAYRDDTGSTLTEAKDAVEALARTTPRPERPRRRVFGLLLAYGGYVGSMLLIIGSLATLLS